MKTRSERFNAAGVDVYDFYTDKSTEDFIIELLEIVLFPRDNRGADDLIKQLDGIREHVDGPWLKQKEEDFKKNLELLAADNKGDLDGEGK